MDLDADTYVSSPLPPVTLSEETTAGGKTKKSKVWNFYRRLEKDTAKCKACDMTIKTQKGNTTGMTRHLFRAHLHLYTELEAMREKEQGNSGDSDDDFSPFKGLSAKVKRKKSKSSKTKKALAAAAAAQKSKSLKA